jgi:hypothetical protein
VLHEAAIFDPPYIDGAHAHRRASRRITHEVPGVGSAIRIAADDLVVCRDHVLEGSRECQEMPPTSVKKSDYAGLSLFYVGVVIDVVWCDQVCEASSIMPVENFGEAMAKCPVSS